MSLYQQLLAALSGSPTQNQRLIKLHTPLGADVLVAERAQIDEVIGPGWNPNSDPEPDAAQGAGTRIVVHALAADAHIELKSLIGQPALLELLTQHSRTQLRPWHGHITRAELLGSDGGLARYRLTIEPWLAFLGHRQDSWIFQNQTVPQIVDEVFADYQAQGKLAPIWRWELVDASLYPQRSLCIQYQETDLQFVQRLLREEGLFCWFEHSADHGAQTLGEHTLVIADHNGAFKPDLQPMVRYTQSHVALKEDSITKWWRASQVRTASLALASPDHRALSLRAVAQTGMHAATSVPISSLTLTDIPGAYAYEDNAQGERLALRQMQAIDAHRERIGASGSVRTTAPARTFTLTGHPVHTGLDPARDEFVVLGVRHTARNNVSADLQTQLVSLVGAIARGNTGAERKLANASDEPLYACQLTAQRLALPVRLTALDADGHPDPRVHARPRIHGVQTALVVGQGGPLHTDRDHRIKVQFHWQRGANASHRLEHAAGSNAPASDASGTWVRVAQTVAGANWGANFTPRLGQEVLVAFIAGDIDRPVVTGSVYNGQGQPDGQGNLSAAGAANATGNAAAWFPGQGTQPQPRGKLQGHQHPAVHTGFKSQELSASQSGAGGYNQLVLDDTAAASRIELGSTSAQTRLQLGHLLEQRDNQRLQARGHGLDLASTAWGAVRAGSGLLLSAHGKPGSQSASRQLDSREPQTQFEQAGQLLHTLAESAQKHNAKAPGEPDVTGATEKDTARQLRAEQALYATGKSLSTSDQKGDPQGQGGAASGSEATIGGGAGAVTAWGRPDLIVAAPGGIGSFTPASSVYSAGNTLSLVAGQDVQHLAQANHATAVKDGLVFYTYGKATNPRKPNAETGIALHAASGSVNTQSQSGATKLTADKAVEFSSTTAMVRITAPQHILLTAGGAAIDMQPGSITIKGPGRVEFRASLKELTGAGSASDSLALTKPTQLRGCAKAMEAAAEVGAAV
jgi:type VI secretion system secreted protein VgrG